MASGMNSRPPKALAPFRPAVKAEIVTDRPAKAGKAIARPSNSVINLASGKPDQRRCDNRCQQKRNRERHQLTRNFDRRN